MSKKKLLVLLIIFFSLGLGFYYRDFIPTTRSDFEGLYYFVTEKKANITKKSADIQGDPTVNNGTGEYLLNSNPETDPLTTSSTNLDSNPSNSEPLGDNQGDNINNKPLPKNLNNYVPFTSQAPLGNWDKFHDAACEEASLVMAHYYLKERDVVFSKEAEKDIQYVGNKMKDGGIADLNISKLKDYAEKIYDYQNWKIINNPSVEDIKKELAQKNIIIIPLAGREIGNPYYKNPGPLYHMLLISGYDDNKGVFITQDPGTKRGKDFTYKFNTLLKANHDFPGDTNKIDQGLSKILIVTK